MSRSMFTSRRITSALLLSLVIAGCASDPTAPSADLLQRIESARTRGDHQALSTHYEQQAAAARATAAEHRKMAKSYEFEPRAAARMVAHCNAIVREQEGVAAEFEGMAEGHWELAKRAQP
jgi:hypothetical protein